MEYVQMTLDDWVQMKQKLKQELLGVKQSFGPDRIRSETD